MRGDEKIAEQLAGSPWLETFGLEVLRQGGRNVPVREFRDRQPDGGLILAKGEEKVDAMVAAVPFQDVSLELAQPILNHRISRIDRKLVRKIHRQIVLLGAEAEFLR
jgi:hypothetical protein